MQRTSQIRPYTGVYSNLRDTMARKQTARSATKAEQPHERIARLRRERGITQKEMASKLEISQGNVSDYERGIFRLHGQLLIEFARILEVSTDEILGVTTTDSPTVKDKRLLRRIVQIDKLSKRDRDAVVRTVDAFLTKAAK